METLLIFFGMALVTFFTRYVMIAALGREVPAIVQRWLQYVPPAVLAALVVPAALAPHGQLSVDGHTWAVAAGAAFAWRTRSVLWTILGGIAVFWMLRIFGA
jgi:branched-subunit amino acid transport protein